MKSSLLLLSFLLVGCDQINKVVEYVTPTSDTTIVMPCFVTEVVRENGNAVLMATNVQGYRHDLVSSKGQSRQVSHCLPCAHASSAAEKHACVGDKEVK